LPIRIAERSLKYDEITEIWLASVVRPVIRVGSDGRDETFTVTASPASTEGRASSARHERRSQVAHLTD